MGPLYIRKKQKLMKRKKKKKRDSLNPRKKKNKKKETTNIIQICVIWIKYKWIPTVWRANALLRTLCLNLLKPAFAFTSVHDYDFNLEGGLVIREMIMTRIKLPAGYDEDILCRIDHKGKELHLSISEITSNFQAEIICGKQLNKEQLGLVADLCRI